MESWSEAVEPRNAASVVLMRPGVGEIELYFLNRHARMSFAAGVAVFPGGSVEARDFERVNDTSWVGPDPIDWSRRLGVTPELAAALVCAAVRETFEETGVLLAGDSDRVNLADLTGTDWEATRAALAIGELGLYDVLREYGLAIRTDLLTPWSCWVTPLEVATRFRTWFFLAESPVGQSARDVSGEADQVMWLTPRAAIEHGQAGRISLWPPQYATCAELYDAATPAVALEVAAVREARGGLHPARFTTDQDHLGGEESQALATAMVLAKLERR